MERPGQNNRYGLRISSFYKLERFNEYRDNIQYSPGVHIDHWYVGNGSEDIYPHATRIISAEVFYKNSTGDVISKSQNATQDCLDAFPLIEGYEAYRAEIEYEII